MEIIVADLKRELDGLVESMRREKEIDDMFDEVLAIQPDNPSFHPHLIMLYEKTADKDIKEMSNYIYVRGCRSTTDYDQLMLLAMNMKGSSRHISLPTVAGACQMFYDALQIKDRKGSECYFRLLQNEYNRMRSKLVYVAELELKIIKFSKPPPSPPSEEIVREPPPSPSGSEDGVPTPPASGVRANQVFNACFPSAP